MGQQIAGSLEGNVADSTGLAVANVDLELQNVATGSVHRQSSSTDGQFVFNLIPAGTYQLTASLDGFQTQVISGVAIGVNRSTRLTVTLLVGALVQTIDVQSQAALIDVTSARVTTNVERKYLTELPSSTRNTLSFAELSPGVQITRPGSQVMDIEGSYARVNGLRQGSNVFYLDGSDNTGSFRNGALQFPNPDTVQEVQVSTANTSAEFGKQPGGVFNVVTKSGTNEIHGSGFYFFRNRVFDANTWDRNRSGTERADNKVKQIGGTIGGPIVKNRTFFFGSFMAYRDQTPGFQNTRQFATQGMLGGDFSQFQRQLYDPDTGAPLANNQIPAHLRDSVTARLSELLPKVDRFGDRYVWAYTSPLENQEMLLKIDHTFGVTHQISGSWFRTWGDQTLPATQAGGNAPAFGPQVNHSNQNTASIRHTWVLSPTVLIQNRYSLAKHSADRGNSQIGRNLEDFGAIWPIHGTGARKYLPILNVSDGFSTQQGYLSLFEQPNYRFGSTLSWTKGNHNTKFGFEVQRDAVTQDNDQDGASFAFDGRASSRPAGGTPTGIGAYGYAIADFIMGRSSNFNVGGIRRYDIYNWSYFLFAQDEWRITPKLTLSPGLRYEFYSPARERDDRISGFVLGHKSNQYPSAPAGVAFAGDDGVPPSLYRQDRNNFSPRLGVAYDPFGKGTTSIRAGFGIYYAYLATQMKMMTAEQTPWNSAAGGGETLNMSDPWGTSRTITYQTPPTPFSMDISSFRYPPVFSLRGYNPNFATPYTAQ